MMQQVATEIARKSLALWGIHPIMGAAMATVHLPNQLPRLTSGVGTLLAPFSPMRSYGQWRGEYPGHFMQEVEIVQAGSTLQCIKKSGDDYVPATATTWEFDLLTMTGRGLIADKGFINPRFIPGQLKVIDRDHLVFYWQNCGHVIFRRDEA